MSKLIKPAIGLFGFLSVLTGIIYPLAVTGIARWVFPEQAKGSLILEDGRALGSAAGLPEQPVVVRASLQDIVPTLAEELVLALVAE
jgi:hypothetical protein